MPSARPATSAARGVRSQRAGAASPARPGRPARTAQPPRRVTRRLPTSKVRWDRKFRTAMLIVLAVVAYIGIKGIVTLVNAHAQAEQQLLKVATLARQNRRLEAEAKSLGEPATIVRDARALGMVRAGERAYVVTGLSGR